jgi:hypothetical protein
MLEKHNETKFAPGVGNMNEEHRLKNMQTQEKQNMDLYTR